METQLLDKLYEMMSGNLYLAALAAFIWGVLSIIISPCHLSSIPLIIGYLQSRNSVTFKRAFSLSLAFSIGILLSLIAVGLITYSLGRLVGDIGTVGEILIIFIFILFGLFLMDIIKLDWNFFKMKSSDKSDFISALTIGFIFGIGLGPCTFAFMAPILGMVFTSSNAGFIQPLIYFGAFAFGHCLVITLAGAMSTTVNKYLQWNEKSGKINMIKKVCGALMILAGLYMAYKTFL